MAAPMKQTVLVSAGVALVVAIATVAGMRLVAPSEPAPAVAAAELDRDQIGGVVRDYLLANPRLLEEVIARLDAEHADAQAAEQQRAIADNYDALTNSQHAFIAGNPDGDVTLIEFFDYNCPYCRQMMPVVMDLIEADPGLRVVFWDWPVLGPESAEASRVAHAVKAEQPERFIEFHRALMSQRGRFGGDRALEVAEELGLDRERIQGAMSSEAIGVALAEANVLGDRLGLRGTPTYVLGDEVLGGAVGRENLERGIAEIRAEGCSVC